MKRILGRICDIPACRFLRVRNMHIAETVSMLNYKLDVQEDVAIIRTDGLHHSDNGQRTTFPKVRSLLAFSEATLAYGVYIPYGNHGKTFKDFRAVMEGRLPFFVSSNFEFRQGLFSRHISKTPITVYIRAGTVGKSSIVFLSSMYNESGIKLWSSAFKVVSVNMETRKPATFPEWWRQRHCQSATNHTSLNFEKVTFPDVNEVTVMKSIIKIKNGDLDYNKHTNWTKYSQYIEDAIDQLLVSESGSHENSSGICDSKLRSVEITHGKETFEGDNLDVCVWKVGDYDNVFVGQIYKDVAFVFQARYTYNHS